MNREFLVGLQEHAAGAVNDGSTARLGQGPVATIASQRTWVGLAWRKGVRNEDVNRAVGESIPVVPDENRIQRG